MEGSDPIEHLEALQGWVVRVPEMGKDLDGSEATTCIELSGLGVCGASACGSDSLDLEEPRPLCDEPGLSVRKQPRAQALGPEACLDGHAVKFPGVREVPVQGEKGCDCAV